MADETDPAPADTDETPEPFEKNDDADKWKALSRKHEKAAKEMAARLQELEDRDKSEGEKLAGRIAAAEKRADDAEARALRLEVAHSKGLTAAQARRLVGDTKEELEADADDLLASFQPAPTPEADDDETEQAGEERPSPTNRPTPSLRGGGDPTQEPEPDIRKVVESIPRSF